MATRAWGGSEGAGRGLDSSFGCTRGKEGKRPPVSGDRPSPRVWSHLSLGVSHRRGGWGGRQVAFCLTEPRTPREAARPCCGWGLVL